MPLDLSYIGPGHWCSEGFKSRAIARLRKALSRPAPSVIRLCVSQP